MKPLIRYALFLIALLSLNACDSEEIYEVGEVRYTDSSALFGVWEWTDKSISDFGFEHAPVYYVLNNSASYYLSGKVYGDTLGWFYVGSVNWSLKDGRLLQLNQNWTYLFDMGVKSYYSDKAEYGYDLKGVHYNVFTVSNPDSVYQAIQRFSVYLTDSTNQSIYLDYAVLSDVTDGNNERNIRLALDSCYQAHQGAASLKDVCDVWDYRKVSMPLFDVLLQHVDTLSSTEIWKALEAYAAKWNK